jgi:acyl dehydratase
MPIDPIKLANWQFEPVEQSYTHKEAILYALGLGLGRDPMDESELPYVYEKDLRTLPTFGVTLSTLGLWVKNPDTGITWTKLVHSGQKSTFHRPLPANANVKGLARISEVWDRGAEKGAVIVVEREIKDRDSGESYCTLEQTLMLRADGGFGGEQPPKPTVVLPERDCDRVVPFATLPGQAILYRLCGDWNPLHVDPAIAASAGFSQPILHGYCSYGIAGLAASRAAEQPYEALHQLECQFSGPVLPGDELVFHFWREETGLLFQAKVGDRIVLNRGRAEFKSRDA